jgi:FtsH-binding integral membrane protein
MTAKEEAQEARSRSRADFMKRLFAVAVSVGFASPLTRMSWIEHGTTPNGDEWRQIVILATALLATIGSWEGYFFAIANRPLKGVWRFIIDITLVLIYMILLISSGQPSSNLNLFLLILVVIFILYISWDALTIHEYAAYYYYNTNEIPKRHTVFTTYRRGICPKKTEGGVRQGHILTLLWALYFVILLIMRLALGFDNVYMMCGMVWLGLLGYRKSKSTSYDKDGQERQKTRRTTIMAAIFAVGFLILAVLLVYCFKV